MRKVISLGLIIHNFRQIIFRKTSLQKSMQLVLLYSIPFSRKKSILQQITVQKIIILVMEIYEAILRVYNDLMKHNSDN